LLPAYILAHNEPPLPQLPTLTVNANGRVYPSKALLRKLDLRAGQPIDLLPPTVDGASWHLDLRLTAARRITWHANTRPRIENIKLPPGLVQQGQLLTLGLLPNEERSPDLYQLLPVAPSTT
jgi:hypothetical protein